GGWYWKRPRMKTLTIRVFISRSRMSPFRTGGSQRRRSIAKKRWTYPARQSGAARRKSNFSATRELGSRVLPKPEKTGLGREPPLPAWLDLEPKNGPARQKLATALFFLEKYDEAHSELRTAVENDPTLSPASVVMGQLYTSKGDWKNAAEQFQAAEKKDPDNW